MAPRQLSAMEPPFSMASTITATRRLGFRLLANELARRESLDLT
jgi:hypothetical protein